MNEDPQATTVFEASWEVCNKVGGIYSVLSSKSSYMQDAYDNYYAIGPYAEANTEDHFEETTPPSRFDGVLDQLEDHGVTAHFGTWKVNENPDCILLEYDGLWDDLNEYKDTLWKTYEVDTLHSGDDVHNPLLFSKAVALLVEAATDKNSVDPDTTILHAHEWLTGFTTLFLDDHPVNTTFTTHATMLGRSMSGSGYDIYDILEDVNPAEKGKELGVHDKHSAERAAAHTADTFTTVSKITGRECTHLLGRDPDVYVLNGLDVDHFPSFEKASIQHQDHRSAIREFLSYTFYPYYTFDTSHNLTFLYAGRYEYKNKGIDIFLEALACLNNELKQRDTDRTISVFLCLATPNNGPKYELLRHKNIYYHLKDEIQSHSDDVLDQLLYDMISGEDKTETELLSDSAMQDLQETLHRFETNGNPPLCSHELEGNESDHQIIQDLNRLGLQNREEDPVKVMLYPAYLDGNDSLLNLKYFEMISGSHLGVFPSYYEPWGYTPVETAAMSVPSVTTDLAGYGIYIKEQLDELTDDRGGIYVNERDGKTKTESINNLYDILEHYASLSHADRVKEKMRAKMLSEVTDWETFIDNYIEAHNKSLN
jgi:glycogen(starch) synthase